MSRRPADECRRLIEQMLGCMLHERFYTSGTYSAPDLGVFAGWVAHNGSFVDGQTHVDKHVALLLAGECFPDAAVAPATRRDDRRRAPYQSAAWLTDIYEEHGDEAVRDLNGIFSGLLIDRRRGRALLFNDRYAMERIYYHEGHDGVYFASEAKALLRILPTLRTFNNDGLADFLRYGCTLDGRTLFRDIWLLPAASLWSFTRATVKKDRYFVPSAWESQSTLPAGAFEQEFHETFKRVLPKYFPSDGVIGISLTGGLDTRMIMACRPEPTRHRLVSYTFAGSDGATIDVRLAARVASRCRVPHHILRMGDDFFANFASLADHTVYVTDGYFGICGAHEIYLNRLARELAPIRLTGNFGSEIFRGVTTFKAMAMSRELLHPDVRRAISTETTPLANNTHPVSFAAFSEIPLHLFGVARAAQSQLGTRTPYLDNELVKLAFRTPEALRKSPKAALHVVRHSGSGLDVIPTDLGLLHESGLQSYVAPLWYRTSFKLDYWRKEGLPGWLLPFDGVLARLDGVLGSHRYLLYRRWFQRPLAGYLRDRLTDRQTLQSGLWNRSFLDQLAERHIKGRGNHLREINIVLTFSAIDRLLFRGSGELH